MNKIHGINFLFMLSFSFGIPTTLLHTIIITNLEFIGIVNLLHYSLTLYIHTFVTLKQDKIFIHFLKNFLLPGVKLLFFLSSPLFMRCRRYTSCKHHSHCLSSRQQHEDDSMENVCDSTFLKSL